MKKILITGGAGFLGSHVTECICENYPEANVSVLDALSYAADAQNLKDVVERNCNLIVGDICDLELCLELTKETDCVVHLAAESHVDRSFLNSMEFTRTNILGTHTLLEACRINDVPRLLHVSTDEVYGGSVDYDYSEEDALKPRNPYSASKASAELIITSYRYAFNLPIVIARPNNVFGVRQYPEKIISKFAMQAINRIPLTVHGDGTSSRHYLAAQDFANAILLLTQKGQSGHAYNIGSTQEFTNLQIASLICEYFELNTDTGTTFVEDRPVSDVRYSIDCGKVAELGWRWTTRLEDELPKVLRWYEVNRNRYDKLFK